MGQPPDQEIMSDLPAVAVAVAAVEPRENGQVESIRFGSISGIVLVQNP